jgi:hypothetical protein
MRPFERRAALAYPYFKLSVWDVRIACWKVLPKAYPSEGEARKQARKPGRYRLSQLEESGKTELEPFEVPSS